MLTFTLFTVLKVRNVEYKERFLIVIKLEIEICFSTREKEVIIIILWTLSTMNNTLQNV